MHDSEETFSVLVNGEELSSEDTLLEPDLIDLMKITRLQDNSKSENDNEECPKVHVQCAPNVDYLEKAENGFFLKDTVRIVAEDPLRSSHLARKMIYIAVGLF